MAQATAVTPNTFCSMACRIVDFIDDMLHARAPMRAYLLTRQPPVPVLPAAAIARHRRRTNPVACEFLECHQTATGSKNTGRCRPAKMNNIGQGVI